MSEDDKVEENVQFREVSMPGDLIEKFNKVSESNTINNKETGAFLCGTEKIISYTLQLFCSRNNKDTPLILNKMRRVFWNTQSGYRRNNFF